MLIAHLPAGFIVGRFAKGRTSAPGMVPAAMIGSIVPDLDIFYFYLFNSRIHHHAFFMHWPLFWLVLAAITLALIAGIDRRWLPAGFIFFFATLLHMVMDTVAAPLFWLAPFSSRAFQMVEVPANYSHWIISFMLHWTFLLELTICAVALAFFLMDRHRHRQVGEPSGPS
ncbi:metal-dependent hydrolase [Oryzifoliimicrobium ureilyticus]|uniref:metal-dependent hydrolase n=1 Tax=Oryzifoliimicrobium ureilyticus TaxID=3113724 RepID=UPI00307667C4